MSLGTLYRKYDNRGYVYRGTTVQCLPVIYPVGNILVYVFK